MGPAERLVERLGRRSDVRVLRTEGDVRIRPDRGFEVALVHRKKGDGTIWTVVADGWHEDFADEHRAAECLAFVLSDACRLKIWSRDGSPFRWTVEAKTEDGWIEASSRGLLLAPIEGADLRTQSNALVRL